MIAARDHVTMLLAAQISAGLNLADEQAVAAAVERAFVLDELVGNRLQQQLIEERQARA